MITETLEQELQEETPDHITMEKIKANRPKITEINLVAISKLQVNYSLPEKIGNLMISYQAGNFQITYQHRKDKISTESLVWNTRSRTVQETELVAETYLRERVSKSQFYQLKGSKHNRNSNWLKNYRNN
jgi:hypothetical protein